MKVKFLANYDSSNDLLKRFIANYDVFDRALTFTTDNDYDLAVVFNTTNEPIKDTARVITVIQEPSWSPVHQNNRFLTQSDHLIIHDPVLFEQTHGIKLGGDVIESPAYMFYHDHVDKSFFNGTEDIEKTKKLSIIVSGMNWSVGNYGKRINLLRKILVSDLDIDIYGRGLVIPDDRYKGELKHKYTGLLPYEYSIAIENSCEKNYITEKFFDCALCSTIPIYYGAPNIHEVYNEQYFRLLPMGSPTIIDDIKQIVKHKPQEFGPDSNKNQYLDQYNLYERLKEIALGC